MSALVDGAAIFNASAHTVDTQKGSESNAGSDSLQVCNSHPHFQATTAHMMKKYNSAAELYELYEVAYNFVVQ